MSRRWRTFYLAVAGLAALSSASILSAANITHEPLAKEGNLKNVELILIQGELRSGDEEKFRTLSVLYDKAIVALDSPGGSLLSGIEIGKMIHLKEYFTLVAGDDSCTSACALIWVAGSSRYLAAKGRVGFHASYLDTAGKKEETGVGNALVGHYLGLLNLPEKAIIFATSASPDRITWLTSANMREAGISFEPFDEAPQPPPIAVIESPVATTASTPKPHGWINIGKTHGVVYFMDHDRVASAGPYFEAWIKTDHSADPSVKYSEGKDLWLFDCAGRRLALKAFNNYDSTGKNVGSYELTESELKWQAAIPDTIGEANLQFVCN